MTTDWPMDPSNETSSDLFGGDLFSDELLDMYHAEDNRKFLKVEGNLRLSLTC